MYINANFQAMIIRRNLLQQSAAAGRIALRIGSGQRINSAADDAAGLTVSVRMRSQIISMNQAFRNIQDGMSMSRTASGALQEANGILLRMRELAVQAANNTLTASDRVELQREFRLISEELDQISRTANFNGIKILDGTASIMASSSHALLDAVVDSSDLLSVEEVTNQYLLDIQTSAGTGQVTKSHIMGLMNGTRAVDINTNPAGGETTGLQSFSSIGLAAGDYRVQTRAQPFGGIEFFNSAGDPTDNTVQALGLQSLEPSSTPNIMPAGSYEVETAAEVPFMATFADFRVPGEGDGADFLDDIIRGVSSTNYNNFDVTMDAEAGLAEEDAETEVAWNDINGNHTINLDPGEDDLIYDANGIAFRTDPSHDANIYSRFEVTAIEDRDILTDAIEAKTYYRSVIGSEINMNLTYKAATDSTMNVEATYRSEENSTVDMNLTYKTEAGSEIEATATYAAGETEDIVAETTYIFSAGSTVQITDDNGLDETVNIDGMNIEEAKVALEVAFSDDNINFSLVSDGDGNSTISVTNNSEDNITISGDGATALGINVEDLANGEAKEGEQLDYEKTHTFSITEGHSITQVAGEINFVGYDINVTAEDNSDGTRNLRVANTDDNHYVTFGSSTVADELDLKVDQVIETEETHNGNNVFHQHTFSIHEQIASLDDLGGLNIEELAGAIRDGMDDVSVNDANISAFTVDSGSGNVRELTMDNNSIYNITFNDNVNSTAEELNFNQEIARSDNLTSNTVLHEYVITLDSQVSGQNIEDITTALSDALNTALSEATVNGSIDVDDGVGNVRSLSIDNNTSPYQLIINPSASLGTELGLDAYNTQDRGVNWESDESVLHEYDIENIGVGDRDLDGIVSAVETAISGVDENGIEIDGFSASTSTVGNLTSITFTNTVGQAIYDLTFSDTISETADELGLLDQTITRESSNNTLTSNGAYDNHDIQVNVGDMRITGDDDDGIDFALNNALDTAINNDQLQNSGDIYSVSNGTTRNISIDNSDTFYEIEISDSQEATASELGIVQTINRDQIGFNGTKVHYGENLGTIDANQDIEEVFDAVDNLAGWINSNWDQEPGYDGDSHVGEFTITNTHDTAERLELVFAAGDGTAELFGDAFVSEDVIIAHEPNADNGENTQQTEEWLARDNITVETIYTGITNEGVLISEQTSTDTWWRGDDGTTNDLLSHSNIPFSDIYIPESDTILREGDTWTLFTRAQADVDHDRLNFRLYDHNTDHEYAWGAGNGDHGGGLFAFNSGEINNDDLIIPQMIRTNNGDDFEVVNHSIETGIIQDKGEALIYSQRFPSGGFDHYAHAYYGNNTTYFFHDESLEPEDVFINDEIRVWRQEDSNATMLFTYQGGNSFDIDGRAYDRDGNFHEINMTGVSINATTENLVIVDSDNEDHVIHFDSFNIDTGLLTEGDKFVVNVAARSGNGEYKEADYYDDHIAITGNPWMQEDRGSSMQYRFEEGAVDGQDLQLLGYFVDPLFGGDDDIGVRTGRIEINVDGNGFADDTRVGGNQRAVLEINFHGTTEHIAAGLLTGHYFQDMDEGEIFSDFLDQITYDVDQQQNAAVVFEVIEEGDSSVVMRAQAHIYGKDGQYRYGFEDYISLGQENSNLSLFTDCGEGLTFSQFDLKDLSRFMAGDRFSLSMAANAEPEDSTHDEIYLWGNEYLEQIHPHSWRFDNGVLDHSQTTLRAYQVDRTDGTIHDSKLEFRFGDYHGGTDTGEVDDIDEPRDVFDTVRFTADERRSEGMGPAHRYSQLKDINFFWDENGRFLLEKPATITIYQGDNSAQVTLYSEDEVMDVIDRINKAIFEDLGQDRLVGEEDRYKFASFVNSPLGAEGNDTVEGTMVFRSAIPGQQGDLVVSGSEDLLRALGMSIIQESEENTYTIDVRDKRSGDALARGITVSGNEAPGILPGTTLRMDSILGIKRVEYDRCSGEFNHVTNNSRDIYVRLADRRRMLQTGPNPGQVARLDLGNVSRKALGVDEENLLTRERANRAVGRLDNAIAQVSTQSSALGALENRLEHNANNISVAAENLTSAESRIRDANIAKEFMQYVRSRLLTQVGYSLLAQANTMKSSVLPLIQ